MVRGTALMATVAEWVATFQPITETAAPDSAPKYFDEVEGVDPNHIFTLVDDEGSRAYIVAGFRRVNRLAHLVTAKPWDESHLESYWQG
jgi:hypothetical protein